jgi:hypothetical protein
MTEQLTLPDAPPYTKARPGQPETSHEQARRSRVGLRQVVADLLRALHDGLTDDELFHLQTRTKHRHSVATRRGELVDLGHVAASGRVKVNRDGNLCTVWEWLSDEPRAENPAGPGTGAAQEGAVSVPDSSPLLHRFERYCSTCGLTVGHWAGCPDDASKWVGEDRHHALHGSWIGAH